MLQKFSSLNKKSQRQRLSSILVVLIVAAVGTYLLVGSHAATPYASINADKGTLGSGATKQTCSGASDGSCVVFGGSKGSGSIVWKGDGSVPIDQQWGSVDDQINCNADTTSGMFPDSRISLENTGIAATSAQGRAIHFLIKSTDSGCYAGRSELNQGNPFPPNEPANRVFNPGNDVWVAFEFNYTDYLRGGPLQFHQRGGCNSPPFDIGVESNGPGQAGDLAFSQSNHGSDCIGNGGQTWPWQSATGSIHLGQWYKVELHINFEDTPTGFVDLYADLNDGRRMKLQYSAQNTYTLFSNALPSFSTIGDYPPAHAVDINLYVAGYTVATTQAAAEANAFGGQGP